jgi:hypothetical protein
MSDIKSSNVPVDAETDSRESTTGVHQDTALERAAVRRMDYTLLPVMAMFYLLSFLASFPKLVFVQLNLIHP